jgi:hypothetical protein
MSAFRLPKSLDEALPTRRVIRSIGLIAVPVLDHEPGHLAVDEELKYIVAHLLAHDGVDAQTAGA